MKNTTSSISEIAPFTTPSIGDTDPQQTLHLGPTGKVHPGGGGVPWHKRLVLTRAPSPTAHHILLVIGSCVSDSATDAWPSIAWLADKSGRSCRVVQRALRELEGVGLISGEPVKGGTTRYRLTADTPVVHVTPTPVVHVTPTPVVHVTPPLSYTSPEGIKEVIKRRKAAALPSLSESQEAETTKSDRHTCPKCGNDWPVKFGTKCFTCQNSVQKSGRLQSQYAARYRSAHNPGSGAMPVAGKYDFLDETPDDC